jgi:DNA-binding response OmpR family regulator
VKAKRILVVDDHPDTASSMALYMQLSGYRADVARTGEVALVLAAALRPDVVVLDIHLNGMSGLEVCRCIRSYAWGQRMQLIAVTGSPQVGGRDQALEAGFDHHFVKPVEPHVLCSVIGRHPASIC